MGKWHSSPHLTFLGAFGASFLTLAMIRPPLFKPCHLPEHGLFDGARFAWLLHRFHVEESRFLVVDLGSRQQRVNENSTTRVDEERVGQLAETEVDDLAEKRVDLYVCARHSLDFVQHENGQALGNYQSYNNNVIDQVNICT